MKFNIELLVILMLHFYSFDAKYITNIALRDIKPSIRHLIPPTILRQKLQSPLNDATKQIPTIIKQTAKGYSIEENKKLHHNQGHANDAEKHLNKGLHHKSFKESSSRNKGSDTKENHNKEYDEEGGRDKKTEDEANESSFHEEGDHKGYGSHYDEAKKNKVRKFEQGFFKSYHKKERNKKTNYFEDQHKGGGYKKYGQGREKHYSTNASKKSKKDGKISKSSTFANSKKRSKIK